MIRTLATAAALVAACSVVGAAWAPVARTPLPQAKEITTAAAAQAAVKQLSSLDHPVRTEAARALRRAPAEIVVPALAAAVRTDPDEYVRYRALTLLSAFPGPLPGEVMRDIRGDRNDRLRMVAYGWYEDHPDPAVLPALIEGFQKEQSEFVRPALTRALAAQSKDSRAREVLAPTVLRGADFFRGAVIEALGDYGGTFAIQDIKSVALLEGPLQDDAITALGRLKDPTMVPVLAGLQRTAKPHIQPTISAALCLLGRACDATETYLKEALEFAAESGDQQLLLRSAAHGASLLAVEGRKGALRALFDVGVKAKTDALRAPVALAIGVVALRQPMMILEMVETRQDAKAVLGLLQDAFDMLSEDFKEEQFFVAIRKAHWEAPADSPRRRAAEALIQALEF
jgi:HEAT repeat protein